MFERSDDPFELCVNLGGPHRNICSRPPATPSRRACFSVFRSRCVYSPAGAYVPFKRENRQKLKDEKTPIRFPLERLSQSLMLLLCVNRNSERPSRDRKKPATGILIGKRASFVRFDDVSSGKFQSSPNRVGWCVNRKTN